MRNKLISLLVVITITLSISLPAFAEDEWPIKHVFVRTYFNEDGTIRDDIYYVWIRELADETGYKINWDKTAQRVFVSTGEDVLYFYAQSPKMEVNGKQKELKYPTKIMDDKMYIPWNKLLEEKLGLRFIKTSD